MKREDWAAKLRHKAEKQLKAKSPDTDAQVTEEQALKLIYELDVHKVEIEMQNDVLESANYELGMHKAELELQNEELGTARADEKRLAEKYKALYDFSPIGNFTLSAHGEIIGLNPVGAQMLGKGHDRLKGGKFGFFVTEGTKPIFNQFIERVFQSGKKETCEVLLSTKNEHLVYVHITGIAFENGKHCLLATVDISERKNEEIRHKKESERNSSLLALFAVGLSLTKRELYGRALAIVAKITESSTGFFYEVGDDQSDISFQIWKMGEDFTVVKEQHCPLDSAVCWTDFEKGGPIICNNYSASDGHVRLPDGIAPVRRLIGIPLVQGGRLLFIIGAANKASGYTGFDVEQAQAVAIELFRILEIRKAEMALNKSEELQKSEEKYRNIFENVYDVYYEALLDGTILEASPSIKSLTKGQFTREELIGKSIVDFYAIAEERNYFYSELAKEGKVIDFELSMKNKDGTIIPVSISSGIMFGPDGRPRKVVGSMRDITERKKAEMLIEHNNKDLHFLNSFALNLSKLPSSEKLTYFLIQQLKEYTNATIVAYSEYNIKLQILETQVIEVVSDIQAKIIELVGNDLIGLATPVSGEVYDALVAQNINKYGSFTEASLGAIPESADKVFKEITQIDKIYGIALTNGEELYGTLLICFKTDVPAPSEELLQSFANLSAVALRRKKAEDDLKSGYERLEQMVNERTMELNQLSAFNKAIVNNAGVTVISTSRSGTIVSFNPAAVQMLGYGEDEVVGKCSVIQFFDINGILQNARAYGATNETDGIFDFETFIDRVIANRPNIFEWEMVRRDGAKIPVLLTLDRLKGPDGQATGFVGVATDISSRKQAEDDLRKSEAENRAIVNAVPDLFFKLDKNGVFLSFHSGNIESLFVPPEMFLGNKVENVLPPDVAAIAIKAIDEARHNHEMSSFEYGLLVKGENLFFEGRVMAIDDDEVLIIIRDITQRKIAEKTLQWNESLLKKMSESSPLGFLVVDNRTDEILYFNHNFCAIWNILHLEEQMRDKVLNNKDIIPDCLRAVKDVPAFTESCMPLQNEGYLMTIEDEIPFVDGRTIRRFSTQIRDAGENYLGRFYIFEDITSRKTAEGLLVVQRDLATGLSAISDLGEALRLSLDSLLRIKNVGAGGIYLLNPGTGKPELIAHVGFSEQFIQNFAHYQPDPQLAQQVLNGNPLFGNFESLAIAPQSDDFNGFAVFPILHEGRAIGTFNLVSKSNCDCFRSIHLSLEAIALQLGGAISRIYAEMAFLSSQQNFKKLFDTIDDFLFIMDMGGKIMIVNSVVEKRLGYAADELYGLPMLAVHSPSQRNEAELVLGEILAGKASSCAVPLYSKNGALIPVETRMIMGKWDDKDVLFAVSRDITERQKAQEELQLRETYLLAVINNHPGLFWIKDLQGRFLIVNNRNDQFLKSYLNPEIVSVIGLTDFDIFPKAQAALFLEQDQNVITTLLPNVFEEQKNIDNKLVWSEILKFPVLDIHGNVIGVSGYSTEITQRKIAEAALKMQSAAFESFALAIIITDIGGNIQWANSAFSRLSGYGLPEIQGRNNKELTRSGKQSTAFYKDLWDTILCGNVWSGEIINKRKDDTLYPEELTITPILDYNGEISGFIAIKIDITKRKQLEESLLVAISKEKELNDLKSRFVSMASHEFRTPLASILITDESLIAYWKRMDELQIKAKLQTIKDQVIHLTNIVTDVMQVSNIHEGKTVFNPKTIDFVALCNHTVQNFNSDAHLKNKIKFDHEFGTLMMPLDTRLIRQVLNNLISNAIKYSPQGPDINVRLYGNENEILLSVQDNGIGIPEADQKFLFQPFYRAGNVKQIQGNGLGLNIVRDSVSLHGGEVTYKSSLGNGTTFVVHLPRKIL